MVSLFNRTIVEVKSSLSLIDGRGGWGGVACVVFSVELFLIQLKIIQLKIIIEEAEKPKQMGPK